MHEEEILKRGCVSNRGFFLRCATLTAILFIIVSTAMGQETTPNAGSLQAIDAAGKPGRECPLTHTSVKAEVSGFISRVTVTQDFDNPFTDKIEAVYTFALPQSAAVDDLTMLIGDRTIKGKVMRREEAQATYTAAKQLGKVAALLDQQRPNIFTQAVANILPGQQIRIVISYVETLKYEEGSYQWTYPMIIGERYGADDTDPTNKSSKPPSIPKVRSGHSISIDVEIDAGVELQSFNSETHETEVERLDEKRAVVRLKDRNTIPNKDFVLTYQTAGPTIDDAVLAHRSERGGFFTLILQPPQRVSVEDVRPKELVFVVDTSGSMEGFPLKKAKETMDLALNTLYPYDTFNVITFAGETDILFSEPQPATPENVRKAKKFLSSKDGGGGTEMMKAIIAALAPSDSQQHVRIACFLTDGQVGNDREIIAEVKKYKNARVFAMGFGDAPNRYLLDSMSHYGRGDVDYVSEVGNTSGVARRFNDRVRNPLMTDITVEWSPSLSISEIYPKHLPDLFSAKPVMISGRYDKGGKGTIFLKGKLGGQDFVREIPVELPETEDGHDVLATLWARRKIEELMGDELQITADGKMNDEAREEITQLGIKFKLMTQYTSFIAVDEVIFTGPEEPRREEIAQTMPGGASYSVVTVTSGSNATLMSADASLGNSLTTRTLTELPVNGRNFQNLALLTPGTVAANSEQFANISSSGIATNGQRATGNMFILDGVSGNFGITPGGMNPGPSASGSVLAATASGSAGGGASPESIQELTVSTWYPQPELGRVPGAQVNVVSRSGTNSFHGSAFYFFGNQSLDANDWFANSRGLEKPAHRLNTYGGTLGGPIKRDSAFFFGSYEGMRLRSPRTGITDVPSLLSRATAVPEIQPFLNAFPLPTGVARPDGFAEFAATFDNAARHDIGSLRADWIGDMKNVWGKYSFADSAADTRGNGGFSLNTTNRIRSQSQTITGVFVSTLSATQALDVRANYSRLRVTGSHALDGFGGAVVPPSLAPASGETFNFDLNSRGANLLTGSEVANVQRQFNIVGVYQQVSGTHDLKFGADYRRMSPHLGFRTLETNVLFDGVAQAITGVPARVGLFNRAESQSPDFNNLSLYAQDHWRVFPYLTLTYGLRWELNPAPSNDGAQPLAVDQVNNPAQLTAAAPGTPLWKTTYFNFAPRVGIAFQPLGTSHPELLIRGGFSMVHDVGQDRAGDVFADSIPFVSGVGAPALVFDPDLKLPYTLNWRLGVERELWSYNQAISASYVGTAGRRLLHTSTLFDQNAQFPFLRLTTNDGRSDYHALQVQFNRRLTDGLGSSVAYTWSKSLDNVSLDSARNVLMTSTNAALDRGRSDFDVRHQVTGFVNYDLPALFKSPMGNRLTRNWGVDSLVNLRSAKPVNVVYLFPTPYGVAYFRPDVIVAGESLYILDPLIEGGRRINPAAFLLPQGLQQGSLGRNALRGYPVYQVDLSLRRRFNLSESMSLRFQADAFNLFNHPNFEDPIGRDRVLGGVFSEGAFTPNATFGRSSSLLGQSLAGSNEGFGSLFNNGGARTLRLSLKFIF